MCPTVLTAGFSIFHSPLCNITLETTTLHEPWEDNQTETYSQGQNNTMPIACFDDKPRQSGAIIYSNQVKYELASWEGSWRGFWTFCRSGCPGT